jgi:[ribosomal protein S18]-alanine N-acetyltransferase
MTPAARIEWLSGPADLDGVQEVDRASFSSPWTREMYEQELQNSGVAFIAVVRAGTTPVAGYCSYRLVAGELQINNVAVRPEFRRQGLGRALVAFVLGHANGAGARMAILEVRRSNEAARRLYAEMGFVQVGERRRYYTAPEEDALVLIRDLRNLEGDTAA